MDSPANRLRVYRELADLYERGGPMDSPMRDRFLVLAADAALEAGLPDEAERLRQRLLRANPHHMLKPFSSFDEAARSPDVTTYLHDLRLNYPLPVADDLLRSLREARGQVARPLPPTAPVIDLDPDVTLPLAPPAPAPRGREEGRRPAPDPNQEPLKVYLLREEEEPTLHTAPPTVPAAPNRPPTRRDPTPPAARNPTPATPLPRPAPRPSPPRPAAYEPAPPQPEPSAPGGAWLGSLLFGVIVTAGVALALYTLGRPF